ncbi:ABC transporter ATP-binding protein [Secundilactobacillus folii]|uniref:ATP-binding cassette domain-containing protein n=1 Tax=Secundilactobacillus folii TaxID=2678357 RepID=A0A7X3C2Z7_9LACO|nr:ATP-binding cassette domain-containing protein [Secundilactobacillus folii]MTV82096.1 ATP-binding cassette domain-containing protein [Secundilactobacillus folii]
MTKPILELRHVVTKVNRNTPEELTLLKDLNLTINEGDFITVLGSNGAGKSTLFNTIAGSMPLTSGDILLRGESIVRESEETRTRFLSRVFQDPKLGTAPRMTVAENLLLATRRGERRGLLPRHLKRHMPEFKQLTSGMGNGLGERLNTPTGNLSGGQRQALSFLMATLKKPDILFLDEHTAALDPKTSRELMQTTNDRITAENLTCLMITHHLDDALKYGNRLIVINDGKITFDVSGEDKKKLTQEDLYGFFGEIE